MLKIKVEGEGNTLVPGLLFVKPKTSINSLAFEVVQEIFKYLHQKDSFSFGNTSRHFNQISRQFSYSNIVLSSNHVLESFLDSIISNSNYARNHSWPLNSVNIKNLTINDVLDDEDTFFDFLLSEKRLSGLVSLELIQHRISLDSLINLFRNSPHLNSLILNEGVEFYDSCLSERAKNTLSTQLKKLKTLVVFSDDHEIHFKLFEFYALGITNNLDLKVLKLANKNPSGYINSKKFEKDLGFVISNSPFLTELDIDFFSHRHSSLNLDGIIPSIALARNLTSLELTWQNISWPETTEMLKTAGAKLTNVYLEMVGVDTFEDQDMKVMYENCPMLERFTYSSYGGSYGVTLKCMKEFVKKCPNLNYIGAYRLDPRVKKYLNEEGVETRG